MEFVSREFIPVLLGGISILTVLRELYEQYQVRTYIFGKYPTDRAIRAG